MARTKAQTTKTITTTKKATNAPRISKKTASSSASKKTPSAGVEKASTRHKPGVIAKREVRKFRKTDHALITVAPFRRMVREIASKASANDKSEKQLKFSLNAMNQILQLVQKKTEEFLSKATVFAARSKRVTVTAEDFQAALYCSKGEPLFNGDLSNLTVSNQIGNMYDIASGILKENQSATSSSSKRKRSKAGKATNALESQEKAVTAPAVEETSVAMEGVEK